MVSSDTKPPKVTLFGLIFCILINFIIFSIFTVQEFEFKYNKYIMQKQHIVYFCRNFRYTSNTKLIFRSYWKYFQRILNIEKILVFLKYNRGINIQQFHLAFYGNYI